MKIPKLYKFKSLEGDSFKYTQDIFVNKRIYLPSIPEFNDPNEGIGEILIENEFKGWGNQLEERNRKKIRVFSLTENYKNTLMWSHYASSQKGICIEFNFENHTDNNDAILRKVEYVSSPKQFQHELLSKYFIFFSYKQKDWEYEQEWRMIADSKINYMSLTDESIKSVYLGPRISPENIEWVKFWLKCFNPKNEIPIIPMTYVSTKYDLVEEQNVGNNIKRIII